LIPGDRQSPRRAARAGDSPAAGILPVRTELGKLRR
jgi:hypothetical protein